MIRNIAHLFIGTILAIGYVFKFMHWPGAAALICTSLIGMVVLLIDFIFQNNSPKFLSRKLFTGLLGGIYVLGVLFKIMHYKGADILLVTSIIGLSIVLIEFAYSLRKTLTAILPLLFSITLFFILFKIVHWPKPPYVLYGSYFAFSILVPVFLFSKGFKLKTTNKSLSNHFSMIGSLSFTLLIFEVINKATQLGKIDWISLNNIMVIALVLFAALVVTITKTLQIQQLKDQFKNDYQLLQCLKGIYLIILVLFTLVKAN